MRAQSFPCWLGLLWVVAVGLPGDSAQIAEGGTTSPAFDGATIYGRVTAPTVFRLEDVVISLEGVAGGMSPPKEHAVTDQRNLTFVPSVLPIQAGTTVDFPNSDGVRHNVFSPSRAKRFNLGMYPRGQIKSITFDEPGVVTLLCNVHPEMVGFIVVKGTPHFTVADRDGRYELRGLPPGRQRVEAWHPRLRSQVREVDLSPGGRVRCDFTLGP